jgi:hypothetical protein
MALFKYLQVLDKSDSNVFDVTYPPGTETPYSGIYRCEVCGKEDTSVHPHPLPPQNHHQHQYGAGPIRWRLVVAHQSR